MIFRNDKNYNESQRSYYSNIYGKLSIIQPVFDERMFNRDITKLRDIFAHQTQPYPVIIEKKNENQMVISIIQTNEVNNHIPQKGDLCVSVLYDKILDKSKEYNSCVLETTNEQSREYSNDVTNYQDLGNTRGYSMSNGVESFSCIEYDALDREAEKEFQYKRQESLVDSIAEKDVPSKDETIDWDELARIHTRKNKENSVFVGLPKEPITPPLISKPHRELPLEPDILFEDDDFDREMDM